MPRSDCRVSIVIPLYNSASTLPRAVRSALSQTLQDIEVLIVDDGSRDTSLAECPRIAATDLRVRVIALPANRGKSHAMNRAIAQANGVWIAVLDADDWYEPDRLATLVAAGEAHEVALVADNQHFWDAAAGVGYAPPFQSNSAILCSPNRHSSPAAIPTRTSTTACSSRSSCTDCIRRLALAYRETARLSGEDFMYLTDFFRRRRNGLPDRPTAVQLDPVVRHDLASVDTDGCGRLAL